MIAMKTAMLILRILDTVATERLKVYSGLLYKWDESIVAEH